MGPMNVRNSSWTAILEYCDIRDAGRAYVAISQRRVSIQTKLITATAEIREVVGGNMNHSRVGGGQGGASGDGSNGIMRGGTRRNLISSSAQNSTRGSPASLQSLSPVTFTASPASSPTPPQKQVFRPSPPGPSPPVDAVGVQSLLETYLANQQSLIMVYQQSLMSDMSRQMSGGNDPAKLATIQANFQSVMKAQADMIEQRKRMQTFIATAIAIEKTIPGHGGQLGQQNQQTSHRHEQQTMTEMTAKSSPAYEQYNRDPHHDHHQQQHRHHHHHQQQQQQQQHHR